METDLIREHYEKCWKAKAETVRWQDGPAWQLPPSFGVLVVAPTENRKMWTYATCGMSDQGDAEPLELHLFSPVQSELHVELLTVAAHYHLTGSYLNLGHTVNFGRPWLPESSCDHGLISLPYLDGPSLEWMDNGERKIRFLWLIPITANEVAYKKQHGLDALESRFEAINFDYLDPTRRSVV